MRLTITPAAQAKLAPLMKPHTQLLLSYDDGVGPYSAVGFCSLDTAFDLLVVDQDQGTPDYDEAIDSNLGEIKVKGYSKAQLAEQMRLDLNPTFNTLRLTSDHEQLDPNVQLKDLTTQQV
ncbi:iron-sulfur cluster biosynthesis family protein [Furfurilactobacillus curtus]|uniref:Core domain-containing protein n=1 Tax=Furfurilactobacillus curtus TaxID=1746200 RepID=A0ABQ5JPL9_9LACO